MELIADLHLHSKYSRAVSSQMVIPEMAQWAVKKGIGLLATGDWTHPVWLKELQANLEEISEGVYQFEPVPEVRFLLSTEIASIYSQAGKVRRIHTLVLAPNFDRVKKINQNLRSAGVNLMSDGRPMTGLSVKELAEIVLSVSPESLIIPSHLWTPWFGTYGDKGGFDSLQDAYGNWAKNIYAIETGLSSDPAANWRVKELDNCSILSFSDAHSPQKLGREASVFEVGDIEGLKYQEIREAVINQKIAYTIEFYPEEGKYHFTGHRKCGVVHSPEETRRLGEICPVCGRPLTVGVMQRVQELAGREVKSQRQKAENGLVMIYDQERKRPPYLMIVPLMEILAEALGTLAGSQRVAEAYHQLIKNFDSEFMVLLKTPTEEITEVSGLRVGEGIKRVREGEIIVEPGYDGVFGKVRIWPSGGKDQSEAQKQMSLF